MRESKKETILFVAGGTGGHIVPALAVAQRVRELEPERPILFCGVGKEIERKLIPGAGFELVELPFPPFRGTSLFGKIKFLFCLPWTIHKARALLTKRDVKAMIAFGGYPSVCPMIAAYSKGVKRLLHEQNQDVGEANKKLEGYASKVFAVTGARGFNNPQKVTFLPLPVRAQFRKIAHYQPGKELKLLVLGGSQGAKRVNEAVSQMLPVIMRRGAHVVHQTGAADLERMKIAYGEYSGAHVVPFIDDVAGALEWADLIVSRAGAMSVAEISAAGRAAIYVPLAIAGAHQSANIKQVVERGAALHVPQDESLDRKLQAEVERLIDSVELRKEMAAKALELSLEGNVASEDVLARELLS